MRGIRRVSVVAVVSAVLFGLVPGTARAAVVDSGAEAQFVSQTNALRASHGLPPLEVHGELVAKARAWANQMAAQGGISHSNLSSGISASWARLGENVGRGGDVGSIHAALVASPTHLRNLIDPGFRYVGVGVVNANGTLYVAEEFMQLASQPAPMPAPATGTLVSPPRARSVPSQTQAPTAAPAPPPPPPPPPQAPLRVRVVLSRLRLLDA